MKTLPILLLKRLLLLPKEEVKLELNNLATRNLIMLSGKTYNNELIIVSPKDMLEENPDISDLPDVGVIGEIKSKIELPNGHLRVKIVGLRRVKIKTYFNETDDFLRCNYEEITKEEPKDTTSTALKRKLIREVKTYIDKNPSLPNTILGLLNKELSLEDITDIIAIFLPLSLEKKKYFMEESKEIKRAKKLITELNYELEVIKIEEELTKSLQKTIDKNQKEFILKEKIKEIEKELGEEEEQNIEAVEWLTKLAKLNLDAKTTAKIKREIKKFEKMNDMSPDASFVRNYLDTFFTLPWNKFSYDETDLDRIMATLNQSHYGLEEIKNRVVEFVAIKKRNPGLRSPILCLVGPPGVGKTTIAMSIAKALKKEFYKISVGGLNDATELSGHRRTYLGSSPGKIMEALMKCGTKNPVLLIDEVDKMTKDYRKDPSSVLLDALDYPQNQTFIDNYVEEPFDLSNILFILTANDISKIPVELKDRLEIIEVPSYTLFEKLTLAREYLLPAIYTEYGVSQDEITIPDGVVSSIITHYTLEAGVRELKRKLETLIRKILTASIKSKRKLNLVLEEKEVKKYLGVPLYEEVMLPKTTAPGLVEGLAWTPMGGKVLTLESCMYEGTGQIIMTGSLQEVMKESIEVAYHYLKAHAKEFNIDFAIFKNQDIHLHALDGATPKDGPSAGIAIVTSILSLCLNQEVEKEIAFTGEISLRGDILMVGGIKEKLIGAFNAGIHTVYLPKENKKDLKKVPTYVLENLTICFVSNYKEIYRKLFTKPKKASEE